MYTDNELKQVFRSPFNKDKWNEILAKLFGAREVLRQWERLRPVNQYIQGYHIGELKTPDNTSVGLFYYDINEGSVERKRVGLRSLVRQFINQRQGVYQAALAVFNDGKCWRLSLISDIESEATAPKRYTYVFGREELSYRTPISRFKLIQQKRASFASLMEAFKVETLSDEFFEKYKLQYRKFVQYITGMKYSEKEAEWVPIEGALPDGAFERAFKCDAKSVRDYIKKMMGRITFLHFLQRKGWMTGELNYMQNLYRNSNAKDNFLDAVLEPLFYGILNTKETERRQVFREKGWDDKLLDEWKNIPYLNGGLFELDGPDACHIKFPQEFFADLFEFFSEYNFTIDENDPDDAEVGVDPEMMGKIFENLLEDNKEKGAFYTPKQIVSYMCRESLVAYLQQSTQHSMDTTIRDFVACPEEKTVELTDLQKTKLMQALANVKICDPAIGSGAFPMGMLHELLRCREALEEGKIGRSELKRKIINENIYGVDIEKGAVDIARLRFWLSLVVEQDAPTPLPNLDYKIMQGNSLLEKYKEVDFSKFVLKDSKKRKAGKQQTKSDWLAFDVQDAQDNIMRSIHEYYDTTDHDIKQRLRDFINNHVKSYIKCLIPDDHDEVDSMRIPNDMFFLWHIYFKEVFDNGGFDIVIGNPPYIQLTESGGVLGRLYESCNFETYARAGDIYCLFYEQSWNMLRQGGHLCFITSNKWMRAAYGESLRKFFARKSNPKLLVDFGGYQVFKNAAVDTNILLLAKEENQGHTLCATLPRNGATKLSDFVKQHGVDCNFSSSENWIILSPIEQSIKQKIEKLGTRIKDWKVKIHRGILTGCNDAFVISTEKRNEILSKCKTKDERNRTEELIRPILRGRDIKKYRCQWAGLWLINTHNGIKGKIPQVSIENYPSIREHLSHYWEALSKRSDQGDTPYNLRRCAYMLDFFKPKIVYGQFQDNAEYSFADPGFFVSSNEYIIVVNDYSPKCLLAFLNSRMMEWYLSKITGNLGGTLKIGQKSNFKKMTIPILSPDEQKEYELLVDKILSEDNAATVVETIDQKIFSYYGMTQQEIDFLQKSLEA